MLPVYYPQGVVQIPPGRKIWEHLSIHQKWHHSTDNSGYAVSGHMKAIHQASVSLTGCQEAECNGKSSTRIDGFIVPGVKFLNPWTHSC